ncbi:MAG: T9SS type A sorting domain-containing protein, partial [Ignavibacteriales bacterium]|nr:T9SS type A sorting domain-containing protein [Ignavibacteriales bacterium]
GGDNGNECIRISNGATSTYVCRTVVEHCYFENTGPGDSEVISVKCREHVLRFNTNINNQQGNFCFRNGDNNIAYGNFFVNAGGIRVKEANNIYCYNNYFENCGDGNITAPVKYVYVSPNLKNLNFIHNTFVNGTSIELEAGATGNTWANNIFKMSSGNIFTGSAPGISWSGNIRSGALGTTISSGMTNADPQIVLNADRYYGLSSTSPAIDAASASYPAVLDIAGIDDDPAIMRDISGQARPTTVTLKDVGCNEYNATGPVTNRPLKLADVGPSYLGGPSTGVEGVQSENPRSVLPSSLHLVQAYPNPFNPATTIHFHVPEAAHVSLRIYDGLGSEVAVLIDEMRQVGEYDAHWNAVMYPSGVYWCRLQTKEWTETKRLLLLK